MYSAPLSRDRRFMLLRFQQAAGDVRSAINVPVSPMVAVIVLHVPAFQAVVLIASGTPASVLIALPAGVLVDRPPKRAVMIRHDVAPFPVAEDRSSRGGRRTGHDAVDRGGAGSRAGRRPRRDNRWCRSADGGHVVVPGQRHDLRCGPSGRRTGGHDRRRTGLSGHRAGACPRSSGQALQRDHRGCLRCARRDRGGMDHPSGWCGTNAPGVRPRPRSLRGRRPRALRDRRDLERHAGRVAYWAACSATLWEHVWRWPGCAGVRVPGRVLAIARPAGLQRTGRCSLTSPAVGTGRRNVVQASLPVDLDFRAGVGLR
ncbi:hypothetical protein JOF41_002215 [Saccharothrix coeruleofusca]|nr:hypothetical protein [Saccharothrix coeruleofusca]